MRENLRGDVRGMEGEKKRERGEGGVGWIKRREKQAKVVGEGEMKWRDRRKERKTRERERVRKRYGMEGEWKRRGEVEISLSPPSGVFAG